MSRSSSDRIDVLSPHAGNVGHRAVIPRLLRLVRHPRLIKWAIAQRIFPASATGMDWKTLASEFGAYSVIDSRHPPEEFEYVTGRQREILFPMLKRLLVGNEQTILDFGCGPGRFTRDLAELISGKAVGCDVTRRLLELAPEHPSVKYVHLTEASQRRNWAFDVAWVTAVLCVIPEGGLAQVVADLTDALCENGLLFLAEPTGEFFIGGPCTIRTRAQIRALFPSIRLEHVGTYYDADQEFSVFAGRRALLTSNSTS